MAYQRDEALTTCSTKNRPFWTLAGVLANYSHPSTGIYPYIIYRAAAALIHLGFCRFSVREGTRRQLLQSWSRRRLTPWLIAPPRDSTPNLDRMW